MTTEEIDGMDLLGTIQCSPTELAYIEICRASAEIAKKHGITEAAEALIHQRIFRAVAKSIAIREKKSQITVPQNIKFE